MKKPTSFSTFRMIKFSCRNCLLLKPTVETLHQVKINVKSAFLYPSPLFVLKGLDHNITIRKLWSQKCFNARRFICTLMCIQYINMWLRLSTLQRKLPVLDFLVLQGKVGFGIWGMGLEWKDGFGIWEKYPRAWANEGRSSAASTLLSCIRAKSIKKKNWLSQFLLNYAII